MYVLILYVGSLLFSLFSDYSLPPILFVSSKSNVGYNNLCRTCLIFGSRGYFVKSYALCSSYMYASNGTYVAVRERNFFTILSIILLSHHVIMYIVYTTRMQKAARAVYKLCSSFE